MKTKNKERRTNAQPDICQRVAPFSDPAAATFALVDLEAHSLLDPAANTLFSRLNGV